ncbi:N-acetylneuraminate synthase family protein [Dyadobacter sandarakinus]|uniref:N-acetylneuraminate synthase family protein n=1 Tax=Dyadobacter sandarakinus TaxID=2747268 RepID=A0ABX7IDQ4_9BACT|nr:N-acetylneuraminate synthase family protein [Dyadobacter sandarakinus]QRR03243.1 N-acetylneuraminate synthase family protein [Dyadobacter sandarakinus]
MNNEVYIIAEVGMAHDGSLGMAHSFIDALSGTGVNAVKFQVHIAAAESSMSERFRINFSYEDRTRMDYWARTEFTREQWACLKTHCAANGMDFVASPFSIAAAELLQNIGAKKIKIASGEVTNHLLLKKIARFADYVLLSSGMSNWDELDGAASILTNREIAFSILQCTTAYPTQPSQWGLNVLDEIRNRYDVPAGFSDHSGDIYAGLAAAAHGASTIEVHATFDQCMFGPDARASLDMRQISSLVKGIRQIENAVRHPVNKLHNEDFRELSKIFGKSLALNKHLKKGHIVRLEDLETKKPAGQGMDVRNYQQAVGRMLLRDMPQWEFLQEHDLEPCEK